jgi:hypothetical protein
MTLAQAGIYHNTDSSNPEDVAHHDRMVSLVQTMLDLHKQLAEAKGEHEREASSAPNRRC